MRAAPGFGGWVRLHVRAGPSGGGHGRWWGGRSEHTQPGQESERAAPAEDWPVDAEDELGLPALPGVCCWLTRSSTASPPPPPSPDPPTAHPPTASPGAGVSRASRGHPGRPDPGQRRRGCGAGPRGGGGGRAPNRCEAPRPRRGRDKRPAGALVGVSSRTRAWRSKSVSPASEKGPLLCHELGTTSAVAGRAVRVVAVALVVNSRRCHRRWWVSGVAGSSRLRRRVRRPRIAAGRSRTGPAVGRPSWSPSRRGPGCWW